MKTNIKKAQIIRSKLVKKEQFGVIGVKTLFNTPEMEGFSAAIIELNGTNKETMSKVSNKFYFVIEGRGKFIIDGEEFQVSPGDLVYIPKGIKYYDVGKMKLISLSHPRFTREHFK